MTNLDIETFWAVVQHGTMTAAAEALYITQPSLSARLKSLEDQVGAPLFHRVKGKRNKNAELSQRSLAILDTMKEEVLSL